MRDLVTNAESSRVRAFKGRQDGQGRLQQNEGCSSAHTHQQKSTTRPDRSTEPSEPSTTKDQEQKEAIGDLKLVDKVKLLPKHQAKRQSIPTKQSFRFRDLPAEARNRVYELAFQDTSHFLAHVMLPPITRVCRQLRTESLPVFFSTATFKIVVSCNFRDWYNRIAPHKRVHNGLRTGSGTFKLTPRVEKLLARAGDAVVMRRVRFMAYENGQRSSLVENYVFDGCRPGAREDYLWLLEDCLEVGIGLEYCRNSGLDVVVTDATGGDAFIIVEKQEYFPALPLIVSKAKEISVQTGFKGFNLDDLKEIARGFRIPTCRDRY